MSFLMSNIIFCFSATGNSLYVAKRIAEKTDSKIVMISKEHLGSSFAGDYDKVGIVFPVYHQGLPVMVQEFLSKFEHIQGKYMYGISTYGDKPTLALRYLKETLAMYGQQLDLGIGIRLPYNYLRPSIIGPGMIGKFKVKLPSPEKRRQLYLAADLKLIIVIDHINHEILLEEEVSDVMIENFVDKMNLRNKSQKKQWLKITGYEGPLPETFQEGIRLMDAGFSVTDACMSCGLCRKVCPADNISYEAGKPTWNMHCEHCLACLHWCPKKAILFRGKSIEETYHHPKISADEMVYR